MNKKYGAVLFLLFLILTLSPSLTRWHEVARNSKNWDPRHPAYYSYDQSSETWAGLDAEEKSGWIEYELGESRRVFGVGWEGIIPEGSWISIVYWGETGWLPVLSSFRSGESGKLFIDFEGQRVESDRFALRLNGPEAFHIQVREIEFLSIIPSRSVETARLEWEEIDSPIPFYYSPDFLVDGVPGTVWNPSTLEAFNGFGLSGSREGPVSESHSGFFEQAQDRLDLETSSSNRYRGFWEYEDTAVFNIVHPGVYSDFSFYLNERTTGTLTLAVFSRDVWETVEVRELTGLPGWQNIGLPSDLRIEKIRLGVSGRGMRPLMIGEIELWRNEIQKENDCHYLFRYSEIGEKKTGLFRVEETSPDRRVEIVVVVAGEGTASGIETRLNGLSLYNPDVRTTNGTHILKYYPNTEVNFGAENNISVDPGEDFRLLCLTVNHTSGIQEFYWNVEESGAFDFEEEFLIHNIYLYAQDEAAVNAVFKAGGENFTSDECESYFKGRLIRYSFDPPAALTGVQVQTSGQAGLVLEGCTADRENEIRLLSRGGDFLYGSMNYRRPRVRINSRDARILGNYFWLPVFSLDFADSGIEKVGIEHLIGDELIESRCFEIFRGSSTGEGLILDLPEEVTYTLENTYRITGSAYGRDAVVFVNGVEVPVKNRIFDHTIPLTDGLNPIRVEMHSPGEASRKAVRIGSVFKMSSPPAIVLDEPTPESTVAGSSIVLRGHVENAVCLSTLEINGETGTWEGMTFSQTLELPLPEQRVYITAVDTCLGEFAGTFFIFTDNTPPVFSDVLPGDETWINTTAHSISGYVKDETPVEVYINDRIASLHGDFFLRDIELLEGLNPVVISAFDTAGNCTDYGVLNVNCDITPPQFLSVSGFDAGWTNRNRQEIRFLAEDEGAGIDYYEISVDEGGFLVEHSPYTTPVLEDGLHRIVIRAWDKAGNLSETEVSLQIDTASPEGPDDFRVIPGNDNGIVIWSDKPDDTVSYLLKGRQAGDTYDSIEFSIDRERGESREDMESLYFEVDLQEWPNDSEISFINGREYKFSLQALDKAGNLSAAFYASLIPGGTVEEYEKDSGTVVEYENVKLLLGKETLPEGINRIVVAESISPEIEKQSDMPLVSPIYSFSVITKGNEEQEHVEFEEEYLGRLDFEEDEIPDGYPEENLGVFYYDPLWSHWYRIPDSVVDTENNSIYFKSNHFSLISIQPTVIQDMSPEEMNTFKFSPFSKTTSHGRAVISPSGGVFSTSMTEFILPGVNGLDLEIRRIYDTSTARLDAAGLSANLNLNLGSLLGGGDLEKNLGRDIADDLKNGALSDFLNGVTGFFKKNGDYAYSMGQGWRLNFPYIRNGVEGLMVRSPSGAFFSLNSMSLCSGQSIEAGNIRSLWFENHEREDFTFIVTQILSPVSEASFIDPLLNGGDVSLIPAWNMIEAKLIRKDGRSYVFDFLGRLTEIEDCNGNCITFYYKDLLLDYIIDSRGRRVLFEYNRILSTFCVPQIKKIWIEDDPQERAVTYEYNNGIADGAAGVLPVLSRSIDCGGREYCYDYDKKFLFSGSVGVKVNAASAIAELFTWGAAAAVLELCGISTLTVHAGAECAWVLPLSEMSGYQIGENRIEYKIEEFYYTDLDAADFFLGFIPTAVDLTAGRETKLCADHLFYTDSVTGVGLTENWEFEFESGGSKQFYCSRSQMDDGFSLKEYSFVKTVRYRGAWASLGDYITDMFNNRLFTRRPCTPEIWGLEESSALKDSGTGLCIENIRTEWDYNHLQPTGIIIDRGGSLIRQTYKYDDWGNVTAETNEEKCRGDWLSSKIVSLYNFDDKTSFFSENPGAVESTLSETSGYENPGIHDRILYRHIYNEVPAAGDREMSLESVNNSWSYDERGNISAEAQYCRESEAWAVTNYTRNPDGEISSIQSPEGALSFITYDPDPMPGYYSKTITCPDVQQGDGTFLTLTETIVHDDAFGSIVMSIDGRGYITEFQYDGVGRPMVITHPDDNDERASPPFSLAPSGCRSDNPKTFIEYEDSEYLLRVMNKIGAVREILYDDRGKIIKKIEYNRYPEEETIDSSLDYDPYGRIIRYIDPLGNITTYDRDILGNILKVNLPSVQGETFAVTSSYDYSKLTRYITDENGNKREERLDFSGRILNTVWYDSEGDVLKETAVCYDSLGNRTSEMNGREHWTHYYYDSGGREVLRSYPENEYRDRGGLYSAQFQVKTVYDLDGFKSSENRTRRDQNISLGFTYNGLGRLIRETLEYTPGSLAPEESHNLENAVTLFAYDGGGNLTKIIDPAGGETLREWSADGKLLSEIDALGNRITCTYDALGRQLSLTDQRGSSGNYPDLDFTIRYKYDDLDRLISASLPKNQFSDGRPEISFTYDKKGALLKRMEENGEIYSYFYDERGRRISEVHTDETGPRSYQKMIAYDAAGNPVSEILPGGLEMNYTYDELNRMVEAQRSGSAISFYQYDENNNLISETSAGGAVFQYTYDVRDQIIEEKGPEGGATLYGYDEDGNRTWFEKENGMTLLTEYDERGLPLRELQSGGKQECMAYDSRGLMIGKVDGDGNRFEYNYGKTGLLDDVRAVGAGEVNSILLCEYKYDESGFLFEGADGDVITRYNAPDGVYTPDPLGLIYKKVESVRGKPLTVDSVFDDCGRIVKLDYPSGEVQEYALNDLGEITGIPGILAGEIKYEENTFLSSYDFLNGVGLKRSYDPYDRISCISYSRDGGTIKSFSYQYDSNDNITGLNGDVFSYDKKNQLIFTATVGKGNISVFPYEGTAELLYAGADILGQKALSSLPDPEAEEMCLDWNGGSLGIGLGYSCLINEIVLQTNEFSRERLNVNNSEVYLSLYNKSDSWFSCRNYSLIVNPNTGILTLKFDTPQMARYIKIHSHFNPLSVSGAVLKQDAEVEISTKSEPVITISGGPNNEFYAYDRAGNRKELVRLGAAISRQTYDYLPGTDLVKTDGEFAYTYDGNNNLTEKGDCYRIETGNTVIDRDGGYKRYTYDLFDRLVRVERYNPLENEVALSAEYLYNYLGYRVMKITSEKTIRYIHDEEGKVLEELTYPYGFSPDPGSSAPTPSIRDYHYLGRKHIACTENGQTFYYGTDHLGSTAQITSASGEIIWSGATTPFAESSVTSGLEESVKFTGKDWDEEAGLYYFNARWYDANLGRFTTEDPVRDGVNWYVYASNNPLRYVDPNGLEYIDIINPAFQQTATGHFPSGNSLSEKGCKLQTITNVINTFRGMGGLDAISLDSVNRYAADNGHYVDGESIFETSMVGLVEKLSGYQMSRVDRTTGKLEVLQAAELYDGSDEQFVGILRTDWAGTDEIGDGHTLNLTGFENGDVVTQDSSNRERIDSRSLRRDRGEVFSRLDTYSFLYTGNNDLSVSHRSEITPVTNQDVVIK